MKNNDKNSINTQKKQNAVSNAFKKCLKINNYSKTQKQEKAQKKNFKDELNNNIDVVINSDTNK